MKLGKCNTSGAAVFVYDGSLADMNAVATRIQKKIAGFNIKVEFKFVATKMGEDTYPKLIFSGEIAPYQLKVLTDAGCHGNQSGNTFYFSEFPARWIHEDLPQLLKSGFALDIESFSITEGGNLTVTFHGRKK